MRKLTAKEAEKLKRVIAENLGIDETEITPTAHVADDLGADSLDRVELVMCIEEEFDVIVSDDEAEHATTYEKIVRLVEKKLVDPAEVTESVQ